MTNPYEQLLHDFFDVEKEMDEDDLWSRYKELDNKIQEVNYDK